MEFKTTMKKRLICTLSAWACAISAGAHADPAAQPGPQASSVSAQEAAAGAVWQALPGQSLKEVTATWAGMAGYELVWDAGYDFPIRAALQMQGDFVGAMTSLFNAYAAADRPLLVDIYKEQKLVRVQARGE